MNNGTFCVNESLVEMCRVRRQLETGSGARLCNAQMELNGSRLWTKFPNVAAVTTVRFVLLHSLNSWCVE